MRAMLVAVTLAALCGCDQGAETATDGDLRALAMSDCQREGVGVLGAHVVTLPHRIGDGCDVVHDSRPPGYPSADLYGGLSDACAETAERGGDVLMWVVRHDVARPLSERYAHATGYRCRQ